VCLVSVDLDSSDYLRRTIREPAGRRHEQVLEVFEEPAMARGATAASVEAAPSSPPPEAVVEPQRVAAREHGIGL
jgi:hypothetical protein